MQPDLLRFATAGSVDDGKSTLIGRLLHDTRTVYEDQLDSVRRASRDGLELAFITDGLRAEREQGITIDVAYRYFSTPKRRFIIADTPGHEQYTRNMATGASTADLAIVLLDARKGVVSQTRRHVYLAWLLGIREIVLAVNKMDLVGNRESRYQEICQEAGHLASMFPCAATRFIPISAANGDNVVKHSRDMNWYDGSTLLEHLETVPVTTLAQQSNFRLPIQYVIRHTDFRGYAGQIASGAVRVGDELTVLPSGYITRVRGIHSFDGDLAEAQAPMSVTISLLAQLDIGRGDMLVTNYAPPSITSKIRATLVWMSEKPLIAYRPLLLKHTTQRVCSEVSRILSKVDIETLEQTPASELTLNDIGEVEIETHRPLFWDPYSSNRLTGSFILIDPITNNTVAAGMIMLSPDVGLKTASGSDAVRGVTVWFTGLSSSGKTTLSNAVYERLWARGHKVEILDGDVVRRDICRDLGFSKEHRDENIRRIGFVADLLTRKGIIVLVSAISPYRTVRQEVRDRIDCFVEVYVNAPLEVCEQRDVKGLYLKARNGQLKGFSGIDDPYEPPLAPEVECRTDRESIAESVEKVICFLESRFSRIT
jgi:bifunctional enzyme CysN/CysC